MKRLIFGIFAHPDDEAFGPCGALLKEVKSGTELHLICLTAGENGQNPDKHPDLGEVRLKEWRKAAELIGATSTHHLGFTDGELNNIVLQMCSKEIEHIVRNEVQKQQESVEVEFMCFDLNGITGHIDHIVASRAACLVFYRLKAADDRYKRVRLFCLPKKDYPEVRTDWLFMENGRSKDEIDETVDARELRDDILKVMHAHQSQRADRESVVKTLGDNLGINHFIVKE